LLAEGLPRAPASNNRIPWALLLVRSLRSNIASTYNLNGWNLANRSYTGPVSLPQTNGSGTITLTGNTANPSLCQVATTTPYGTCISVQGAGTYYVGGFRCATGPGRYYGIEAQAGYMTVNGSMQFGPCTVAHIVASDGALV
jgi:hypothetical protein